MVDADIDAIGSPPTVLVRGPATGNLMRARYLGDAGDGRAVVSVAGQREELPVVPLSSVPELEALK